MASFGGNKVRLSIPDSVPNISRPDPEVLHDPEVLDVQW